MSLGRVVHAQIVADLADHHRAGLQVERRVAGALAVVLVGNGSPEQSHDPVARAIPVQMMGVDQRPTNIPPRRVTGTRSAKKIRWYQTGINDQRPA